MVVTDSSSCVEDCCPFADAAGGFPGAGSTGCNWLVDGTDCVAGDWVEEDAGDGAGEPSPDEFCATVASPQPTTAAKRKVLQCFILVHYSRRRARKKGTAKVPSLPNQNNPDYQPLLVFRQPRGRAELAAAVHGFHGPRSGRRHRSSG